MWCTATSRANGNHMKTYILANKKKSITRDIQSKVVMWGNENQLFLIDRFPAASYSLVTRYIVDENDSFITLGAQYWAQLVADSIVSTLWLRTIMGFNKKLYSNSILIMGRAGNTLLYTIKLLSLLCSEKWSLCWFKQRSVVGGLLFESIFISCRIMTARIWTVFLPVIWITK